MPAFLLHYVIPGTAAGNTVPLEPGTYSIGRVDSNDISIKDPRLSRVHAQLQVQAQQVFIIDLNASNGVEVDGVRIPPNQWTPLRPGSKAVLGSVNLHIEPAPGAVRPAVPPPAPVPYAGQPQPVAVPAPPPYGPPPPAYHQPAPAGMYGPAPSQPPPVPAQPPPVAGYYQQPAGIPAPAQAPPAPRRANRTLLLVLGGLFACLCLVLVLAGAVYLLYPRLSDLLSGSGLPLVQTNTRTPEGGQALALDPPVMTDTRTLTAAEGAFSDQNGANLTLPAEALPGEESLTVETASLSSGMQSELEQSATVDSPLYSVTAASMDGVGRAALSLPAPSPDSRLAVLVDDQYLAVLPILPENGMLAVRPFLGAPGAAGGYPTMAQATLPNRYFVITPKIEARQEPAGLGRLASLAFADTDMVSCTPIIWHGNRCYTNQAGSVFVLYSSGEMPAGMDSTDPLSPPVVIDGVIKSIVKIMSTYQQSGLTSAAISSSNPVYLVISASEKEPNYSQKTGNVYLGWGVINELSAGKDLCTIAHELFHWVEDEEYAMNGAALANDWAWFLEMGAENGAFMLDTACISKNLSTYGVAEVGNLLAWQSTPFHWDWGEGARYIQALQMYISICDGGGRCAMSLSEFTGLINAGSYPSTSAREAYYKNADDMGRYLLGFAPLLARGDAFIPAALHSGSGYGDYIWIKNSPQPTVDFSLNEGRIRQTARMEATASTTIAYGGEYPLWVSNGKGSPTGGGEGFTTLPAILTISPGAAYWYSLDNAAPVFNDGSAELVLGAISDKLGTGLVRIIATAPTADAAFKAVLKPVDLSGDLGNLLSNTTTTFYDCPSSESDSGIEAADFVGMFSSYGAYEPDPAVQDGSHYIWAGEIPMEGSTAESDITVSPDKIVVNYLIDIPRPVTNTLLPWLPQFRATSPSRQSSSNSVVLNPLAVVLAGIGLALAVLRKPRPVSRLARALPLLLAAVSAGLWLSGCFGFVIWGTFKGTYTYTHLEVASEKNLPAEAAELTGVKWVLTGKGQIDYELHVLVVTEDDQGNKNEEEQACIVQFATDLTGVGGLADMVPPPDE